MLPRFTLLRRIYESLLPTSAASGVLFCESREFTVLTYSCAMDRTNSAEMICHACATELAVGEEYLQCMVKNCGKLYHYLCTNKKLTLKEKDTWVCPECCIEHKKTGRNCETPVGTPITIKNISNREKSRTPLQPPKSPGEIAPEIQLLRDQMSMLSEQLTKVVCVVAQYQTALADYTKKFEYVNDRLCNIELGAVRLCECSKSAVSAPVGGIRVTPRSKRKSKPSRRRKTSKQTGNETRDVMVEDVSLAQEETHEPLPPDVPPLASSGEQSVIGDETKSMDSDTRKDGATGDWQVSRNRKKRFSSVRCTAGPDVTSLRAVEYRKYIHLWNMVSGADEIREYLQSLGPGSVCTVDELRPKGEYRSFKIGVPPNLYEECLSAGVWPDNARIRPWLFRRPQGFGNSSTRPQKETKIGCETNLRPNLSERQGANH